jgi:hypothetical protein
LANPTFEQVMTGIVGTALLLLFGAVAVAVVFAVDDPPLLGDVAPSTAPELICRQPTPTMGSPPPGGQNPPTSASPKPIVPCAPNEIAYAPQFRGSYDSTARLTALIAIVAPLVTSIVSFYFGHRAGASEGRAAKAEANQVLSDTQRHVHGMIQDPGQRDELVQIIEEKKFKR